MENKSGTLYLVATPIGNLEDMTFRAVRVLTEVDLIGAEDTRNSRKLLSHYQITTSLTSYHEHNQNTKGRELLAKLLRGLNVALITDAGLPGISDPGSNLVQLAIANGVNVIPIPGASAAVTALIASGINTDRFLFFGFLARRKQEREKQLKQLRAERQTVIIYEAPHRLRATLQSLVKCWHGGQIVVARELTKKFEEFVRGTAGEVLAYFLAKEPKGEMTLILAGNQEVGQARSELDQLNPVSLEEALEFVSELAGRGMQKKEAIKEISKKFGINKRELYNYILKAEGKKSDS